MSNAGHRHRNHPSTPIDSWQKHEFLTIIDKPAAVEKQKEDALFADGFRRSNH